jgi:hypothetical protein
MKVIAKWHRFLPPDKKLTQSFSVMVRFYQNRILAGNVDSLAQEGVPLVASLPPSL